MNEAMQEHWNRIYSAETLEKFFGPNYELQESFDCKHRTQSGKERPFVYALFKRKK